MVKYSIIAFIVIISLAYVTSESSFSEEGVGMGRPLGAEIEDSQMTASNKVKRGIYGPGFGYGYGRYSLYPYGYYGGLGHGYYPYYYPGLERKFGHGYGYLW